MDSVLRSREVLAGLDPDQRAAVTARADEALLVAAGPGAGKTRVLTHRIAWLIANGTVGAGEVLALTFTNAAASEMGERLRELIGAEAMRVRVSTIHALAARICRAHSEMIGLEHDFSIYDQDAQLRAAAQALTDGTADIEPAELVRAVGLAKSQLRDPDHMKVEGQAILAQAYIGYDEVLRTSNALDFEGLIVSAIKILSNKDVQTGWSRSVKALMVDEFQDVSEAQFELIRLLTGATGKGLTVIGDEDQSLYSWRGASTALMAGFERNFPVCQVITLVRNYRSHDGIVQPAAKLIGHNEGRRIKELTAIRPAETTPQHLRFSTETAEANGIVRWVQQEVRSGASVSEMVVLFRVRSMPLKNELELALTGANIPYHAVGSVTLWERSEVRDVLALFHLLANPKHKAAFARVLESTPGLGEKATDAVLQVAKQQDMTPVEAIEEEGLVDLGPKRNRALDEFAKRIGTINELSIEQLGFAGWVGQVIAESGYPEVWREDPRGRAKRESVIHLYRAAEEFEARCQLEQTEPLISDWLSELSLHAPQSGPDAEKQGLALATIHASKGLEYSHVWVAGMDEGVLPSRRSLEEGKEEEERRLAYVALTRAKDTLTVSSCEFRRGKDSIASRFLDEAGLSQSVDS